jgi:hypothetical protein
VPNNELGKKNVGVTAKFSKAEKGTDLLVKSKIVEEYKQMESLGRYS